MKFLSRLCIRAIMTFCRFVLVANIDWNLLAGARDLRSRKARSVRGYARMDSVRCSPAKDIRCLGISEDLPSCSRSIEMEWWRTS